MVILAAIQKKGIRGLIVISPSVSWADPEISKGGGGVGSRRGRILGSGICFDAPSHIPYVFVARVVNKIYNVYIVYGLKSK